MEQWPGVTPPRAAHDASAPPTPTPEGQDARDRATRPTPARGRTQLILGAAIALTVVVMVLSYPAVRVVAEATGQSTPWLYALMPGGMILVSMQFSILWSQIGKSWWWPCLPLLLLGVVLQGAMWISAPDAAPPDVIRVAAVLLPVALWAVGMSLVHQDRRSLLRSRLGRGSRPGAIPPESLNQPRDSS